jgi:glycosyltransferase involved in cell wall biosynthesis
MRLAVVGPTPPYRGGIAHFNARLLQALEQRASVLAIGWADQFPSFLAGRWRDPSARPTAGRSSVPLLSWRAPRSWTLAADTVTAAGVDRILLHWAHPFAAPVYLALSRLFRQRGDAPLQFIVHNAVPHEHRLLGRVAARVVLRAADRLLTHSVADADLLRRWFPDKTVTAAFHPVYDIFEGPSPSATTLGPSHPVLLFFGFIRRYKGLDVLLDAFPQVLTRWPEALLLVAGQPFWRRGAAVRQAQRMALGGHVRLETRYIQNEEVASLFRAADLVVLPYRAASQSGVLQVAYAFDRPVVATRVGGLAEAVEEGVSGRLAEPGSASSLAAAIEKCLEWPISPESVRAFRQRFNWERYVDLLLA